MGETRFIEVKRHLDGRAERFDCALLLRQPHLIVVRFDHNCGRRLSGIRIPAGSRSYGFVWRRRPYVLYRIEGPDRGLLAHRFDVVEHVRFGEGEVSYMDLILDIWVMPDGWTSIEDEDEVAATTRAGLLSLDQRRRIGATKSLLLRRWRRIVREAETLAGRQS